MSNAPAKAIDRPDRVKVTVPDTYKQVDESVWEELEKYIFQGFLISHAFVANQNFVFKTLNHHELRIMGYMRPTSTSIPEVQARFRAAFIAYSIFMVDGNNALYDRPRHINRLIKAISKLPVPVQDEIIKQLAILNEMANRLSPLVEPYAYENRSRFKWFQICNQSVHSRLSTGIAGTEELGMNSCQQTWVALNRIIDRRDGVESDWSHAKFIGSCFAGKGIRSIDEKDKMRREKERVDREELKLKVLHKYLNRKVGKDVGDEEPVPVELPDGRQAKVVARFRANSAEELADQLSAALSGEKDYHDMVIEAKEKELRKRAEAIEAHKRKFYQAPPLIPEIAGGGSRVLGGKQEASAYLARMQALREEQISRARRPIEPSHESSDTPDKIEE